MTRRILCVGLLVVCAAAAAAAQTASRGDGWVVLSVPDYHELRARASPPERPPDLPPVDATITQIAYDLVGVGRRRAGTCGAHGRRAEGWLGVGALAGRSLHSARHASARRRSRSSTARRPAHDAFSSRARAAPSSPSISSCRSRRARARNSWCCRPRPAAWSAPQSRCRAPTSRSWRRGGLIVERGGTPQTLRVVGHASVGQSLSLTWHRKRDTTREHLPLRLRSNVLQAIGLGEEVGQIDRAGHAPMCCKARRPRSS